jgi:hypothetical protein
MQGCQHSSPNKILFAKILILTKIYLGNLIQIIESAKISVFKVQIEM